MSIPKGYKEIHKMFYNESIKKLGLDIDDVDGVFFSNTEVVITGIPRDENHNCDAMGCSSISHVIHRHDL